MISDDLEPGVAFRQGLEVYADGCFEPVSATGGWAFVIHRDGIEIASDFGHIAQAANNAMEVLALLEAARWIEAQERNVPTVIWSDSVYAVTGSNHWRPIWKSRGWRKKGPDPKARSRVIPDRELWVAVDAVLSRNPQIRIRWCKGHSGIPGNEKADMLAEFGRRSGKARNATQA